jgi:hypothetical protein
MREFFTYGSVRGAARKGRSLPRLTMIECQVSSDKWIRNEKKEMKKKITVPILCAMLFALCLTVGAQQTSQRKSLA